MNMILQMAQDSIDREKNFKKLGDGINARLETKIKIGIINTVLQVYAINRKYEDGRVLKNLRKINFFDTDTAVDLMNIMSDEKVKCPEQDGLIITRDECLDYSGDHTDDCRGCEIGKTTKQKLLGEKEE